MSGPDPFGTARLRAAALRTWRDSPTRLREDTATEADLVAGGYRDRVLTELAQNAADAADRAQVPGELTVRLVDGALRVANTGAPLDSDGVAALAALRASAKASGVGRFGVGFTAVLAVSDAPRVLSRTGSVGFSLARTRDELGLTGAVPVLRLVWPVAQAPEVGDTEVVLPLRAGVDGAALLAELAAQAPELLLELVGLHRIALDGHVLERTERALGPGRTELHVGARTWWQQRTGSHRWLVELVDGQVQPQAPDVLRAPTRTDEELSLPALLVADVALQPDRRRLLPGISLDGLAEGYPQLLAALPAEQRTRLVPLPGFPRGDVDARLREQVLAALRTQPWLPAAGPDVAPRDAVVLDRASPALVDLLAEVVPGLLTAELAGPGHTAALAALDVSRLGLAAVADAVAGLGRAPDWWRRLYAALDELVHGRAELAELAALPVPLVDGRTVLGPHTVVLTDVRVDVPGLRVVHPDAVHPLLARLGASEAGAAALLAHPALREAVEQADPDDVAAAAELARAVLALVAAAGVRAGEHPWLGGLLLPDGGDELRAADELLLPGAPLAAVLDDDSPFGTLAPDVVAEHGAEVLRAVGVGWGFTVLVDDDATGPGRDLDRAEQWWLSGPEPSRVHAVRDLELVAAGAWPAALALLHGEPDTLAAVREPGGHTAWWLRRFAELDGAPLGHWRAPEDLTFAGLLDPVPVAGVDAGALAPAEVDSAELAQLLLDRLADAGRTPTAAVVAGAHAALARAVEDERVALDELDPPERVRATGGSVVDADTALVLDRAWLAQVVPAGRLVLGALGELAAPLAELLDLDLASETVDGAVVGAGERVPWGAEASVVLACAQLGVPVPAGDLLRHTELMVRVDGRNRPAAWWVTAAGQVHATGAGLLPALLHQLGDAR